VEVLRGGEVKACSLHAPYGAEIDPSSLEEASRRRGVARAVEAMDLATDLGAPVVVVHASEAPIPLGDRRARIGQARQSLSDLATAAAASGLRLAVETMPPEWLPAGSGEARDLVESLDPDVAGFCLDTNHANLTGSLPQIVDALRGRVWCVHLSDNDGRRQRHWMPLQGAIEWRPALASLEASGLDGPVIYELDPDREAGLARQLQAIVQNWHVLRWLSGKS